MKFGQLLTFRNPSRWARPPAEVYREQVEQAVLAEQLGFDHVWTSEHHFDDWSPSPLTVLAAIATRTERIRLGTFIVVLPFQNPVRVAEDAATVDLLSGGRLDLGVGTGAFMNEFETLGIPYNQRASRTREALEIIRRCFTEERFSFKGRYHEVRDLCLWPRSLQKPHPPIWVAAIAEKMVRWTAQSGYYLAGAGGPGTQRIYDQTLKEEGRDPNDYRVAQLRWVYVAESREQAWEDAEAHLHYVLSYYERKFREASDQLLARLSSMPSAVPAVGELRHARNVTFFDAPVLVGTPEDAVKELERYRRETRVTDVVLWMQLFDPKKVRRSMELFAKEVMPHFRD